MSKIFYYGMLSCDFYRLRKHGSGAHPGVCLAVMTSPCVLQVGYSALRPLSLQVSNAGGLEQATAYISLLMLHSTIRKQQHPCLV